MEEKKQLLELGCLWKKESKKGEKYLTGVINLKSVGGADREINLVVFFNRHKERENHPDLKVYYSEPRNASPSGDVKATRKPAKTPAAETPVNGGDSDSELL